MKVKIFVSCIFLFLFMVSLFAAEQAPKLVSPGSDVGIAMVGEVCPTFSWTSVAWAVGYRLEVFNAPFDARRSYEEISISSSPVLIKEIPGSATSWSPSLGEKLTHKGRYIWYIQAFDAYGKTQWSNGMLFEVDAFFDNSQVKETIHESLRKLGISTEVIDEVLYSVESKRDGKPVAISGGINPFYTFSTQAWEGSANTLYGMYAGYSITPGSNGLNAFFGRSSGENTSTGTANSFFGHRTGLNNTIGGQNTFIGTQAGVNLTTGHYNTFIGCSSGLSNETGSSNIFIGYRAGEYETGSNKLYIESTSSSAPLIYGDFDQNIMAVNGNLGIGFQNPVFPIEVKKTGANASMVLGRTDGATNYINATSTSGNFGTVTNHVLRLVVNSLWQMRIHTDGSMDMRNGASCTTGGVWTNASSRDLKDDINDLTTEKAIEALKELQPVTYKYKADMEDEHVGFIAEDVPELVASKDRKGMSPMDVVAVLTKVLQEQQKINQELRAEIAELKGRINQDK